MVYLNKSVDESSQEFYEQALMVCKKIVLVSNLYIKI